MAGRVLVAAYVVGVLLQGLGVAGADHDEKAPPKVSIPQAYLTEDGLLVGGQPTTEHLRAIRKAGYRTIVSLRTPKEPGYAQEKRVAEELDIRFVSIPVAGPSGITKAKAQALAKVLQSKDVRPAVVHCGTGQRASALLGLKAFVTDGMMATEAILYAKKLGMKRLTEVLEVQIRQICAKESNERCDLRAAQ